MRVVDLSFPIRPHFRWKVASELRTSHARGDNFQSTILTIGCHAYTHVDAPNHFLPGDRDVAAMPVDQWLDEAGDRSKQALEITPALNHCQPQEREAGELENRVGNHHQG